MIQFEPPYKGMDKTTHFPLMCHGVVVVGGHVEAIIVNDEGDLLAIPVEQVSVDWRFDPKTRGFISIDDPSTAQGD